MNVEIGERLWLQLCGMSRPGRYQIPVFSEHGTQTNN